MEYHYDTVANAVNALKKQGFTKDFNIDGNSLICDNSKVHLNDFKIVDVYRYEGNSDPSDEAAVYAIESSDGSKGVLVTGYGASADPLSAEMLEELSLR